MDVVLNWTVLIASILLVLVTKFSYRLGRENGRYDQRVNARGGVNLLLVAERITPGEALAWSTVEDALIEHEFDSNL